MTVYLKTSVAARKKVHVDAVASVILEHFRVSLKEEQRSALKAFLMEKIFSLFSTGFGKS